MIDLSGKQAFVTEGSRGIGRATVLLLARARARVAIGFRRRREEAEEVVRAVAEARGQAPGIAGDLSDPAAARRAVDEVVAALEAGREGAERAIPLGRIAQADDVAGPIVFLCSALARHITGEVLNMNGGSVLCG